MRTALRLVVVLALLALVGWGLRLTWLAPEPVPVTVHRVDRGLVEETVTNSKAGTVKSRRRAGISTEVGGRVVELPAREGDRVAAGDLLLRLGDEEHRAQVKLQERAVQAARSTREEACLAAEQARRDLDRTLALSRRNVVSEDAVEQATSRRDVTAATCQAARARVLETEAALDVARTALDKTRLLAPFSGVVAELRVELGEYVTPGTPGMSLPSVIDLLDPDAIYVSAPLDEVDLGKVEVGQRVRLTLDPHPGESLSGRIVRIAPYVEDAVDQNRTFEVEVDLEPHPLVGRLLPGTTADVEIILAHRDAVLRVPSYALLEGGKVLAVEGEHLVEKPVETGLRNWQFVEVVSGLQEGLPVVVSLDRAEVVEGAFVEVTESDAS
ncbi:MAG: efflux RND transporter periplasmic adaptor subunit [Acidobacteriota bacterium]